MNYFGDSDFAGELETRKTTSGGVKCTEDNVVKTWSSTQSVIALSSGEAEMYAINLTATQSVSGKNLIQDLGINI